jgi:hypothetical protein
MKCARRGSRRVLVAFEPPKNNGRQTVARASPHWTQRIA